MRRSILAGAAVSAVLTPAAALPPPARAAGPAAALPAMLVCDAGSCRHRFSAFRARPNWNGCWARQAEGRRPAERPARR